MYGRRNPSQHFLRCQEVNKDSTLRHRHENKKNKRYSCAVYTIANLLLFEANSAERLI